VRRAGLREELMDCSQAPLNFCLNLPKDLQRRERDQNLIRQQRIDLHLTKAARRDGIMGLATAIAGFHLQR